MNGEDGYFTALKLFLLLGPLLGFGVLELILLWRDRRRTAGGRPLVPLRPGAGSDGRAAPARRAEDRTVA